MVRRWLRARRPGRIVMLTVLVLVSQTVVAGLPEPCGAVYKTWRWSLKQGRTGVWVRKGISAPLMRCDALLETR